MVLPALWALRNLSHDNNTTRNKIGSQGGIEVMLRIAEAQLQAGAAKALGLKDEDEGMGVGVGAKGSGAGAGGASGGGGEEEEEGGADPEVMEAALATLTNLCLGHERNCRKVSARAGMGERVRE